MASTGIGTETGAIIGAPEAPKESGLASLRSIALPLALAAVVLLGWQLAVTLGHIPPVILPSPVSITKYIFERYDILLMHAIPTTLESAASFVLATLLGIALAIIITYSQIAREALYPNLVFFQLIPKIALAPLFIIWFGIGIGSKVALAAIMVFFLVFYNVYTGVRSVDRELVNLTLVMGANQRQLTYHVYFPAAAPYVLLGMRMAVPYSVIGVIVGEFTSSIQGLGLFIHEASSTYDPAGVFAGIVILLAFVVAANFLAGRLERRLLRWKTPMASAPTDI
jgi:NitT/TauT family transport system permease protein